MSNFAKTLALHANDSSIYALALGALDDEIFPVLPKAFWAQAYLAIIISACIATAFFASFIIRYRRGRLESILVDGAMTRLQHVTFIPLLYMVNALSLISFTCILRRDLAAKTWSGDAGRFWLTANLPIPLSFMLVSVHVLASAPAVRVTLSKRNKIIGIIFLNALLLLLCSGLIVAIFVPAVWMGRSLLAAQAGYEDGLQVIQTAMQTGNVSALWDLQASLAELYAAKDLTLKVIRVGGIVYSAASLVNLCLGLLPALALIYTVRRRIATYENAPSLVTMYELGRHDTIAIHLPESELESQPRTPEMKHLPIPIGSPFSNTIPVPATDLPHRYQCIVEKSSSARQKADELRKVSRRDELSLLAYLSLLGAFSGYIGFMASGGEKNFSTKTQLIFNGAWNTWAFLIPASLVAFLFLRDSLSQQPRGQVDCIGVSRIQSVTEDNSCSGSPIVEKKMAF